MRKSKILVVDDERGFTRLLKYVLSRYEIMEVNDPQCALETARQCMPDLILLDVIMPGLDGGDLATLMRSDPALKRVPIVFLTAIVSPTETGPGSRLLGGYPFLAKPVRAADLVNCLEEQLRSAA
jgi:two-component system OmpR family response regulator